MSDTNINEEPTTNDNPDRLVTLKCYMCPKEFKDVGDSLLSADEFFCSPECAEDYVEALSDDGYGGD